MKYIEVDEQLYRFIASKTEKIGESASDILRRLLELPNVNAAADVEAHVQVSQPSLEAAYHPNDFEDQVTATSGASNLASYSFNDAQLAEQKGAVGRFLFALNALYLQAPSRFKAVLQVQGRDRLYFARSKVELLEASKSSNPKEIGDSGYWVTTNNNTGKKLAILTEVLQALGCGDVQAHELANTALPQ